MCILGTRTELSPPNPSSFRVELTVHPVSIGETFASPRFAVSMDPEETLRYNRAVAGRGGCPCAKIAASSSSVDAAIRQVYIPNGYEQVIHFERENIWKDPDGMEDRLASPPSMPRQLQP
jgi:hypothetical protein